MNQTILTAVQIAKKYNNQTVLNDISMRIGKGEAIAIVGANGSGKSTLLRILAGLTLPTSGTVTRISNPKMSFIPDHFEKTNLSLGRFMNHMRQISKNTISEKLLNDYYEAFHLENMRKIPMKYLSKGTLQKAAVIQGLLEKTDCLFMDEPLSGQDMQSQYYFADEVSKKKKEGMAIIMCCHERFLIEELADSILLIDDGNLTDGTEYVYGEIKAKCMLMIYLDDSDQELKVRHYLGQLSEDIKIRQYGKMLKVETKSKNSGQLLQFCLSNNIHIMKYEEKDEYVKEHSKI